MTHLQIRLPVGTYGRIAPRSGLAVNHYIDVGAGVIDRDFLGNVGVVLFNHGHLDYIVNAGDRIAQLICEKIAYPRIVERHTIIPISSERGACGFGSSGQ